MLGWNPFSSWTTDKLTMNHQWWMRFKGWRRNLDANSRNSRDLASWKNWDAWSWKEETHVRKDSMFAAWMELEVEIITYNEVTPAFSEQSEITAVALKEPVCDCVIVVKHTAVL